MIPKYHRNEIVTFTGKIPVSSSKVGIANIYIPAFTKGEAVFYDKHGTPDKEEDDLVKVEIGPCKAKPELTGKTVWVKYKDFNHLRD